LCAVKNLTAVSSCGIYTASGDSFAVLKGYKAPETILDSPVYPFLSATQALSRMALQLYLWLPLAVL
jgi:hypothetical protein